MRKEGAELVQACEHHKGAAVMLGCQGHNVGPHRSHDTSIGQHHMRTHQHLHNPHFGVNAPVHSTCICACQQPPVSQPFLWLDMTCAQNSIS